MRDIIAAVMPRQAAPKVVYVAAPRKRVVKRATTVRAPRGQMFTSVRGSGAYSYAKPGPWGRIGSTAGGMIGSAMGSPYGLGKAGGAIGKKLGSYAHYIGKLFGSGDYASPASPLKSNVLMNSAQIPQFADGPNTIRIRHREYLGDIISSPTANTFQLQSFAINPGVAGSYPWLAGVVGGSYQQYRINGQVYEFRSMSADALNSVNTALGQVIMATDYDSADALFTTKQEMENTEFGVSCKPSSCMIHGIECARNQTSISEQYVRAFAVPTGKDPRLYDMGNFQVATNGFQGTSVNAGELWVSYDITFFKTIQQPPGYLIPYAHYPIALATAATQPLTIAATPVGYDNIGLTVSASGLVLTWPLNIQAGSLWQFDYMFQSTAGGAAAATAIGTPAGAGGMVVANRVFLSDVAFGYSTPNPSPGPATDRIVSGVYYFKYDGSGTPAVPPTLTLVAPTVGFTAYLGADFHVTMINPAAA